MSIFFLLLLMSFLWPSAAHAWGPGMHVELALRVLDVLPTLVPSALATLLAAHPQDFIYGTASPDIIVGKKYAGYQFHCHNWRMGKLILDEAKSPRQQAAAWGYLVHLAADVVAHNAYVPAMMVRSFAQPLLGHVYWEMRFELGVSDRAWTQMSLLDRHQIDEFDELLERVLRKTLFSFATNKRIFNSILILHKMQGVRSGLRLYARGSRHALAEQEREEYHALAWKSVSDFLSDPASALCLNNDPAGIVRLDYANGLRRRMRRMKQRGLLSQAQARQLIAKVQKHLIADVFDPDAPLPDVTDIL